ncbi:MAG: NAD-binding protein [Pyramidobacter sp.]
MASNYSKKVKRLKRGANLASRLHKYFFWILAGFLALVFGSAYLYWKLERGGEGSVFEALWTILFTLIGQGEFANNPHTVAGRVIVFVLSVIGISVLGVVLSEVLTRVMKYNLKSMLGLNMCHYKGHTVLCGWNARAELVLKELLASGQQVAVLYPTKPAQLSHYEAFFVAGEPTSDVRLIQAGIERAESAIVFAEPRPGLTSDDVDAQTVLTALAVESLCPEVYTVVELLNPANARHARRAHVDDIVYCESTLADIVATCTSQPGISSFISDILTYSDSGSALRAADIDPQWEGKRVGDLFAAMQSDGELPLGIMTPEVSCGTEHWSHEMNPPASTPVKLPMRVVFISKNTGK